MAEKAYGILVRSPQVPVRWPSDASLGDGASSGGDGDKPGDATQFVPVSAAASRISVYTAAEQGEVSSMKLYLAEGGNVNKTSKEGYSILHLAAMRDQEAMVKLLVKHGADPDAHDNGEELTPLMWAAQLGHVGVVTALLQGGADAEQQDREDLTALHWAARLGQERVVLTLLDHVADVEAVDYDGNTPLIWAVRGGHRACVSHLLDYGASTKTPDENGNTALHFACQTGNAEITSDLLDWGALATAQDYWQFTPFHRACSQGHGNVLVELLRARAPGRGGKKGGGGDGGEESEGELFSAGRIEGAWGSGGNESLGNRIGGSSGSLPPAFGLSSELVDVRNHFQATPLHRAAAKGHAEVVMMLVQNGANVDARDGFFYTPLHLACVNGAVACVEVLLLSGADPSAKAQGGITPLIAARKPEVRELVKEALAAPKSSLWNVDISGPSSFVDTRSSDVGGLEGRSVWVDGGEDGGAPTSTSMRASLAAAIAAVLATPGAAGGHDEAKDKNIERLTATWDQEIARASGFAESAPIAATTDTGTVLVTRGRSVSRFPNDKEARRTGSCDRPRRSSTGAMLQKLFRSSSGPYNSPKFKDEGANVTSPAPLVPVTLTGAESGAQDSNTTGLTRTGKYVGSFSDSGNEAEVETPGQMMHLHRAPRLARRSFIASTNAPKAGEPVETGAVASPQLASVPCKTASALALPCLVSPEDGDMQEAMALSGASAATSAAPDDGTALRNTVKTSEAEPLQQRLLAAAAAAAVGAGGGDEVAIQTATRDSRGPRGAWEGQDLAAAPMRGRHKKRRVNSLPPSSRRDRRQRAPRPCLEGPAAVIQTLTLEDDYDDREAWAITRWFPTVEAACGDGGEGSPPPSPTTLPMRRATTLVA